MKTVRILALLLCAMCLCSGCEERTVQETELMYIDFLNTGKSDCSVIRMDGLSIVCDTAEADDSEYISRHLKDLGIESIDYLILSHHDRDHIGSAADIIHGFEVKKVYAPDYYEDSQEYEALMAAVRDTDTEICLMSEDVRIQTTHGEILINPPEHGLYDDDNNNSVITRIQYGETSVLLTGDALKSRLGDYMESADERFDLIKLPHHGDYNKKLAEMLEKSEVKYGVVCADKSHETVEKKLLKTLVEYGVETYFTSNGDVCFMSDGKVITPCR